MRIAILWTCLSGYLNACLKELASRNGVQLFVCDQPLAPPQAPFDDSQFSWIPDRFTFRSPDDADGLAAKVRAFNPEILVFGSWNVPAYRRISKMLARKAFRVMTMDNCWRATPKQRMGALIAPWYVRPFADAVWLPGEPQAAFAKRLGFEQRTILRGVLSCDQPTLERVHLSRVAAGRSVPRAFIFVGRFVECKGLDQLTKAYELYRSRSINPWPLICCGAGPLEAQLTGRTGIHLEGFIQPDRLSEKLATAGCLILPSTLENWSIAVHEAASAGLLIVASENVGAAAHLVQSNYNGFIFKSHDVGGMSALMTHISELSEERLDSMSRASNLLSKQFTPARWADTLLEGPSLASFVPSLA